MPLADPREPAVVRFVAERRGSDYQEHLFPSFGDVADFRTARALGEGLVLATRRDDAVVAIARLARSAWDERVLGVRVATVGAVVTEDAEAASCIVGEAVARADADGVHLVTARVDAGAHAVVDALRAHGFRPMDALRVFLWDARADPLPEAPPVSVAPFGHGDAKAAVVLGAEAFRFGRVASDPRIEPARKAAFYAAFIEGILADPTSLAVGARDDEGMAGFAVGAEDPFLARSHPFAYLGLIAVRPSAAGRGVGAALLRGYLERRARRGRFVEVATQVENAPALRVYERAGLRPVAETVSFHRWAEAT